MMIMIMRRRKRKTPESVEFELGMGSLAGGVQSGLVLVVFVFLPVCLSLSLYFLGQIVRFFRLEY